MSEWERFTFYYGTLVGYRMGRWEIIPTNGRVNSWDVFENGEWVGESFPSISEAKDWCSS